MNQDQFVYWLQGFSELTTEPPTHEQWQSIKEHLALVFDKRTPPLKLPDRIVPPIFNPPTYNPPIVGDFPTGPKSIC